MKKRIQGLSKSGSSRLKEQMQKHNSVEMSYALARSLRDEAIRAVHKHGEQELISILEEMMGREF